MRVLAKASGVTLTLTLSRKRERVGVRVPPAAFASPLIPRLLPHAGEGAKANAGTASHSGAPTNASTRSGLPLPFSIFSGGQISTAPAGGSRSRLLRHCSP